MNYRAGVDEARHLMGDSGTKVLITETRYRDLLEPLRPETLSTMLYFDDGSYEAARDGAEPDELSRTSTTTRWRRCSTRAAPRRCRRA